MVKIIIQKVREFFQVNGKVQKDVEATKITSVDNKGKKKSVTKVKNKKKAVSKKPVKKVSKKK